MTGDRIKELREGAELSQKDLGKYAAISQSTLSNLERGEIAPKTVDILVRLANYFHVSTDYLLGVTDDPRSTADLLALSPHMAMPELLEVAQLLHPLTPDQRRPRGEGKRRDERGRPGGVGLFCCPRSGHAHMCVFWILGKLVGKSA